MRVGVRPLLTANIIFCLEKCFSGALISFYAKTRDLGGISPNFSVFDRSTVFLDKNPCLAKIRTAINEKREIVLEPSQ